MKWIIVAAIAIAGGFVHLWYFVKCLGVKGCRNKDCRYSEHCFRYQGGINEEEKEELLKYLEQLQNMK